MKSKDLNVLVIGSGAREHVLWATIKKSPRVARVLCSPGNGGIPPAYCHNIKESDFPALWELVKAEKIDLVVVGPEMPLANGIVDFFTERDVAIFGPTRVAARIESDKAFSKALCGQLGVLTSEYQVVDNFQDALNVIKAWGTPIVIKANGLCAGNGVTVADSEEEALKAAHNSLIKKIHGEAGLIVVIERCLKGRECSVMAICDGYNAILLPPARDYKRIFVGDKGPNTGGMGAYSPLPDVSHDLLQHIKKKIILPVLHELGNMGRPYHGLLYAGIMLTEDGPQLLEFNCRFGDPETQVVVPRLQTDLVDLMLGSLAYRGLSNFFDRIEVRPEVAVCVVAASEGYPEKPVTGFPITIPPKTLQQVKYNFFHAGTKWNECGQLITSGGRVLSVVGMAETHQFARFRAYAGMKETSFYGMQFRSDIAEGV